MQLAFPYSQSLQIISGGNPKLKAETSDSYTYGVVIQPRWIPGLSVSSDYYNIAVNKVITAPDAQAILDACYDLASTQNPFCSLFQRAGPGGGPRGEVPGQTLEASLLQVTLNYAKLQARGIDTEISYAHKIGSVDVGSRLTYTHSLQRDDFLTPTEPGRAVRNLSTPSYPEDEFNWNIDAKANHLAFSYKLRYISHVVLNAYEDLFSFQGRPPQNADYANVRFYPEVFYHDVRLGIDVDKRSSFYIGVDNVTDVKPPYGLTGIGGGSGVYDNRGRYFYAGIKLGLF